MGKAEVGPIRLDCLAEFYEELASHNLHQLRHCSKYLLRPNPTISSPGHRCPTAEMSTSG